MTSQHDIRDCRDEMSVLTSAEEAKTQYENFQQLTCLAMSMSQEHLQSQQVNQRQSSSPDSEIPMLHNPQSMKIMQSEPWTLTKSNRQIRRTACCYSYHINPSHTEEAQRYKCCLRCASLYIPHVWCEHVQLKYLHTPCPV
ncbi:hypothetical protein DPMN_021818 [Dreissena polymorpha]|uniref:Uncharacterized protein n=1 Tax=Dreissena polymorpha TaxID=45954 RepID=A0A9D4NNF0_DREPO|nr:hypothetical protein DPMN_021818 [Dreissena polymorpha]